LWKLCETGPKPEHDPGDAMASAKAEHDSPHKGSISKQLNHRHLDRFSTSPNRLRLLLVFLLLHLI
jgi:hypothetical protein